MPDQIICRTCGKDDCKDWGELAEHINSAKDKAHNKDRAGKMWAKRYIHRNAINKLKQLGKELPYRVPLTDGQREAKEDTRRILSGKTKIVLVKCPSPKCRNTNTQRYERVEVEHAENPQAWRVDNCFAILCGGCR